MSDKDVMPIEVPTDEELFDTDAPEVVSTDEPKAEETEETVEAKDESEDTDEGDEGRDRDERGRYRKKSDESDHRVPLTELLNEREKRQQIQAQFEAMQQHLAAQEQQRQQAEQQQQWPDIFENPEFYQQQIAYMQQMPGYIQQQMQQQVNQQLAMARMEFLGELSLRSAKQSEPETYKAAWEELERRVNGGDNTWRQQVLTSDDPGDTLLSLYKRENTVNTVGEDPEAYFQRRIEDLRGDPQALAQLLGTPSRGGQSQAPKFNLPPSLTKAGSAGAYLPQISGRDLWEEINS